MLVRAAVTSSDGKTVDLHFGQCEDFTVLEIDTGSGAWRVAEHRKTERLCRDFSHEAGRAAKTAERLADCRALLTYRIGPYPGMLLAGRGVLCLETTEEEPVPIGRAARRLCEILRREGRVPERPREGRIPRHPPQEAAGRGGLSGETRGDRV